MREISTGLCLLLALGVAACGGDESSTGETTTGTSQGGGGEGGSGGAVGGGGNGGNGAGGAGGSGGMIPPSCGDGVVDYADGEECDDGNNTDGDGCSAGCAIEAAATCGDGNLDLQNGEECDDGNTAPGDGCSPTCQFEPVGQTCGDGNPDMGEACDDGNTANGDGCNPTCNFTNSTSVFVGQVGNPGGADGVGTAAQVGGFGNLTANATHLFLGDGGSRTVRQIEVATADVQTIAGNPGAGQGYMDDPTGTNAVFGSVESIATDGSTVWIADAFNSVIRAMSTTPPYAVTTVAGQQGQSAHMDGIGNGARLDGIRGLTFYNGFVYFLDGQASTLRRLDPATQEVVTLAGTPYTTGQMDGPGPSALFVSPRYMASDNSGMLYIADTNGNQIRSYNTVTTDVGTFAGSGACGYADGLGTAAIVHRPRGMTSDGTSIYWVEFNAHTIRQATVVDGNVTTMLGTNPACTSNCGCGGPPAGGYAEGTGTAALFDNPFSMTFHFPSNSLFVLDGGNAVIRRVQ